MVQEKLDLQAEGREQAEDGSVQRPAVLDPCQWCCTL